MLVGVASPRSYRVQLKSQVSAYDLHLSFCGGIWHRSSAVPVLIAEATLLPTQCSNLTGTTSGVTLSLYRTEELQGLACVFPSAFNRSCNLQVLNWAIPSCLLNLRLSWLLTMW